MPSAVPALPVRIVLDTNLVFSALLWRGTTHRLLSALRDHPAAHLCSSSALLEELSDVLADYLAIIELVEPQPLSTPVSRDPDDDQVLACALAAHATLIVSGDRDLLTLGTFQNIPIVTATLALDRIDANTGRLLA